MCTKNDSAWDLVKKPEKNIKKNIIKKIINNK
jgi:hypothetical protein